MRELRDFLDINHHAPHHRAGVVDHLAASVLAPNTLTNSELALVLCATKLAYHGRGTNLEEADCLRQQEDLPVCRAQIFDILMFRY